MSYFGKFGIATLVYPQTTNGNPGGINISLKNALKAYVVAIHRSGAAAAQGVVTLAQSTGNAGSASGTGEKALTNNVPIWINEASDADSLLTATTAAKAYTFDINQTRTKIAVFEVDPIACMDLPNGFDCLVANVTGGDALNFIDVFAIIEPRYSPAGNFLAD
jgi:hypothetical protein